MSDTPPAADAAALGRLCAGCGLCCSGAIYEHAEIRLDEIEAAAAMGIDAQPQGQFASFPQPCRYSEGTICTRYEQERLSICHDFWCELARACMAGSVSIVEARDTVASAVKLGNEARALFLPGETFPEARKRWQKIASTRPGTPDEARFSFTMTVLNRLLDRHFRRANQAQAQFTQAQSTMRGGD